MLSIEDFWIFIPGKRYGHKVCGHKFFEMPGKRFMASLDPAVITFW